jgi:hypothetical protein
VQVCGIPSAKANDYFKAAYDAATLLNGKFSLYTKLHGLLQTKLAQGNNFAATVFRCCQRREYFCKAVSNIPMPTTGMITTRSLTKCGMAPTLPKPALRLILWRCLKACLLTPTAHSNRLMPPGTILCIPIQSDPFANVEGRLRGTRCCSRAILLRVKSLICAAVFTPAAPLAALTNWFRLPGRRNTLAAPLVLTSATDDISNGNKPVDVGGGKFLKPCRRQRLLYQQQVPPAVSLVLPSANILTRLKRQQIWPTTGRTKRGLSCATPRYCLTVPKLLYGTVFTCWPGC